MIIDFSKPQRQSAAGIVTSVVYALQQIVRAVLLPLILLIVKSNKSILAYGAAIFFVLIFIAVIFGYLYYLKFTFYLDLEKKEFILNKGIFSKKQLTIPLNKIQQVNINQGFLQKIIGVYSLAIDTAGTDSKEVTISAINANVAYALKEHLLQAQNEFDQSLKDETVNNDVEISTRIIKLQPTTLLKTAVTSNYGRSLLVLIGFCYAIYHNLKDLFKILDKDKAEIENYLTTSFTVFSLMLLCFIVLTALLITNISRTFIKYFDFEIFKKQQNIQITAGLFAKKNTLITPQRVQTVIYSQNYFQKHFNLFNLDLLQASAGNQHQENEKTSNNLHIPGCNNTERDEILKLILGQLPNAKTAFLPNFRFLNLPILFWIILPIIGFSVCYAYTTELRSYIWLLLPYIIITSIMIYISYKNHRITVSNDFIIKQHGIWDISQTIIEPHKIQSITTSQYIWHKQLNIGHVNLHTAAGSISFMYGNYNEINSLVNYWLYQVEISSKNWM